MINTIMTRWLGDHWRCRIFGCRRGPEYTGIHSTLRMGCHKYDCPRCGKTWEMLPS